MENMEKKSCECGGHSCAGGSCGGLGGGMGMGCMHGGCHGGRHYLLKMLLKLIILALIFMFGFNLGQMTGFIKAGYSREIMRGGNYGEGMMRGYNNYSGQIIPPTTVTPTPAR